MPIKLKTSKQYGEDKGLKYILHKELSISQKPRSLKVLHASELTHSDIEFCPRERAFLLKYGDNRKKEFLGTALNITYQTGKTIEDNVRNIWLRRYVLGDWKCGVCNHVSTYQTEPDKCICGNKGKNLKYIEPRAYSKKYDTSCGIDFLLYKNNKLNIVEVKSLDKDYFKPLKAPMAEHTQRTRFYLDLLSESDWVNFDIDINLDFAYILYVSKAFGVMDNYEGREGITDTRFSPFKEFVINRGKHKDMKHIYDRALKVKGFKKTGIIPKREVCSTVSCKRAGQCTYKSRCFS